MAMLPRRFEDRVMSPTVVWSWTVHNPPATRHQQQLRLHAIIIHLSLWARHHRRPQYHYSTRLFDPKQHQPLIQDRSMECLYGLRSQLFGVYGNGLVQAWHGMPGIRIGVWESLSP